LEINQGYTMMHGQPVIKIYICVFLKICRKSSSSIAIWQE